MASNHKEIRKAIVVEIDDAGSPADETSFNSKARGPGCIFKISFAVVVIQNVGVIGKMRFE